MAWRAPRYNVLHAGRDAGVAALAVSPAAATDFPVDNLIDDRAGSLFKFTSSGADSTIDIDRGAAGLEAVDRLIIPAGHNFTGTYDLEADDNSGFSSPTALVTAATWAAAGAQHDISFTANTEQFLRIKWLATAQWEVPQIVWTRKRTPVVGPNSIFLDRLEDSTLDFSKPSGVIASLQLGPDRRRFQYQYRFIESADELVFDAIWLDTKTLNPFWLDPAFDDEPVIWVKFTEPIDRQSDTEAPLNTGRVWQRALSMLQHIA